MFEVRRSVRARHRLAGAGASILALAVAGFTAGPALAQQPASPGSAQCPRDGDKVTCTGDMRNGFRSIDDPAMRRLSFENLTQPIVPPFTQGPTIDIQMKDDLVFDLDSTVIVRATNPMSTLTIPQIFYTSSSQTAQPTSANARVQAGAFLKFDPAQQSTLTLTTAALLDLEFNFMPSGRSLQGGYVVSGARVVDVIHDGQILLQTPVGDGSVSSLPFVEPIGIYIDRADRASVLNTGSIALTSSVAMGMLVDAREVVLENRGLISIAGNAFGLGAMNGRAVSTAEAAASLSSTNSGTIVSTATDFFNGDPDERVYMASLLVGRGTVSFANSGTIDGVRVSLQGTAQSESDDIAIDGLNTGTLTRAGMVASAGVILPNLALISQELPGRGLLPDEVRVNLVNQGVIDNGYLGVEAEGRDVAVTIANSGAITRDTSYNEDGQLFPHGSSLIEAQADARLDGSADIAVTNEAALLSANNAGQQLIVGDSSHTLRLTNSGSLTARDTGFAIGIAADQGEVSIYEPVGNQILSGNVFDGALAVANSGTIDLSGIGTRYFGILVERAFADIDIGNSGAITITTARPAEDFAAAGIVASGYGDIALASSAPISILSSDPAGASAAGMMFAEISLSEAAAQQKQSAGILRGYDRAADLASRVTVSIGGDVAATGPGSYGLFGLLGLVAPGADNTGLELDSHSFANTLATARIEVAAGARISGGSGNGAAVGLQGIGAVTLTNAGTLLGTGGASSGALILGDLETETFFETIPTRPSDAFLDLVGSINSGTIRSDLGYGIWAQNGAIRDLVNRGLIRGGAAAIAAGRTSNVLNEAGGTIDGRIMLTGAGSRLDNEGRIQNSSAGFVSHRIEGDFVQSGTGRLSMRGGTGGRDLFSVSGNLTLAGDLDLELGAPSTAAIFDVGGNLSLDGVLHVTDGGGFGEGLYRLFDYGGTLADNGLEVHTLPGDTSGTIQTSIAQQVNLIVTGSAGAIQFWDGADTAPDGIIDGGTSVWDNSRTNWTRADGSVNDPWGGRFAIFQGQAGTVAVDAAGVSATGLQFAVDGYRIEGGPIALAAPATLRVGDGTATGAGFTATVASALAGSGGIDKNDLGRLVLTGGNSYTGGTRISAGTLQIGDGGATGAILGDVANAGSLVFNHSDIHDFAGGISGAGSLVQAGVGTLVLTGAATHSGGTRIDAGTLQIGNGGTTGSIAGDIANAGALVFNRSDAITFAGAVSGSGTLAQAGSGALILTGASSHAGGTTIAAGTLQVGDGGTTGSIAGNVANEAALVFDRSDTLVFAGSVSGGGSLTKAGSGTLVLTGASSHTGGTVIAAGTLQIGAGGTAGSLAGDIANASMLVFNRSDTLLFGGAIDGAGSVTQAGTGTTVLTGNSSYSGGTTVAAGTLQIGNGGASGSIQGNVGNAGSLIFNRSDAFEYGGAVTGSGSLTQGGAGTLILTGANTYSGGTMIAAGTLQVGNGGTVGSIAGNVANAGTLVFDRADTHVFAGSISGAGSLAQAGSGTLILTGANSHTGGTSITAGTLQIGDGGTTGSIAGNIANGATLVFNRSDTVDFGGSIGGAGNLVKAGGGTLRLTGASGLSGATRVDAGTLAIDGSLASAEVRVASGASLTGAGSLAGAVLLADGARLAPGNGIGTIRLGSLGLSAGSILDFDLGTPNAIGGSANDLVEVTGGLVLDGILNVANVGGFGDGIYRLINYGGALTDNGLSLGSLPGSSELAIQAGLGRVNLVVGSTGPIQFWDGADTAADGVVDGGTGIWNSERTNWTRSDGSVNQAWGGQFGVFQGQAGVVAIDPAGVTATGLQFAVDGYRIEGGPLALAAPATLRVGDGSNPGAAFTATIASEITGSGGIEKSDLGRLILSGANTYSGGTRISQGILQIGAGGTSGSILGNVANAGSLVFNRADSHAFAGAISGTGSLTQAGTGTLILTGTNSHSGGTQVSAGTLQVGNGGTSGSISGDIANAGALVFNRSDSLTYSGAISGTGSLTQAGDGTLILTGANSHSGGTQISAGTLQVGNGGTSGSIAGNIANAGTLVFNRSDNVVFGGTIGGTGGLGKSGGGILRLTAANAYTGATRVDAGTLAVDGSLASADVRIASGAVLTGAGSLAGAVQIADGAHLAPGNGVGTIRLGSLALSSGSILAFDLGAPNAIGTTANDLIEVTGGLVLDGILNVTNVGGFGDGVYRLINYGGALADNGLSLGTIPSSSALAIQAGSGRVNLVVGSAGPIQFWDGADTVADGQVDGGNGIWSNDRTNWTRSDGSVNDAWGGRFAIFQGAAGTVTVDAGGVTATGLQFASDGYRVEGGPIALAAPATLRVGDGSAAGAGFTATIASALSGSGGIDKTDLGILILTGANSYSGGTRIGGGVLQIASDAALGAAGGALTLDGGSLRAGGALTLARAVTVSGGGGVLDSGANNLTLSGALAGAGALTKTGSGTLTLSGNGTGYTGNFALGGGAIRLDSTLGGSLQVSSGTRLGGTGTLGNLVVAGTLAPGNSVGTLSATGNVVFRAGSTFEVEIAAAGGGDRLAAAGSATIEGGAVRITTLDPETEYVDGRRYTFLSAAGGRTGQFAGLLESSAFLDFALGYDATTAFVTLSVVRTFPDVAVTFNQGEASTALAAIDRSAGSDGLAVYNSLLLLDQDPARAAFDAASGEIYPVLMASGLSRNAARSGRLLGRAFAETGEGFGLWGGAEGSDGRTEGDGNGATYRHRGFGGLVGVDYREAGNLWALGLSGGAGDADAKLADRGSRADGKDWHVGGYARYGTGGSGFSLAGSVIHAEGSARTTRAIAFGTVNRATLAHVDLKTTAFAVEARYGLAIGGGWSAGPRLHLDSANASLGAFSENGAASLGLSGRRQDESRARYGGGAFVRWDGAAGTLDASLAWMAGGGDPAEAVLLMTGASATPFRVRSAASDSGMVEGRIDGRFALGGGWSLGAGMDAGLGNGERHIAARATLGLQF